MRGDVAVVAHVLDVGHALPRVEGLGEDGADAVVAVVGALAARRDVRAVVHERDLHRRVQVQRALGAAAAGRNHVVWHVDVEDRRGDAVLRLVPEGALLLRRAAAVALRAQHLRERRLVDGRQRDLVRLRVHLHARVQRVLVVARRHPLLCLRLDRLKRGALGAHARLVEVRQRVVLRVRVRAADGEGDVALDGKEHVADRVVDVDEVEAVGGARGAVRDRVRDVVVVPDDGRLDVRDRDARRRVGRAVGEALEAVDVREVLRRRRVVVDEGDVRLSPHVRRVARLALSDVDARHGRLVVAVAHGQEHGLRVRRVTHLVVVVRALLQLLELRGVLVEEALGLAAEAAQVGLHHLKAGRPLVTGAHRDDLDDRALVVSGVVALPLARDRDRHARRRAVVEVALDLGVAVRDRLAVALGLGDDARHRHVAIAAQAHEDGLVGVRRLVEVVRRAVVRHQLAVAVARLLDDRHVRDALAGGEGIDAWRRVLDHQERRLGRDRVAALVQLAARRRGAEVEVGGRQLPAVRLVDVRSLLVLEGRVQLVQAAALAARQLAPAATGRVRALAVDLAVGLVGVREAVVLVAVRVVAVDGRATAVVRRHRLDADRHVHVRDAADVLLAVVKRHPRVRQRLVQLLQVPAVTAVRHQAPRAVAGRGSLGAAQERVRQLLGEAAAAHAGARVVAYGGARGVERGAAAGATGTEVHHKVGVAGDVDAVEVAVRVVQLLKGLARGHGRRREDVVRRTCRVVDVVVVEDVDRRVVQVVLALVRRRHLAADRAGLDVDDGGAVAGRRQRRQHDVLLVREHGRRALVRRRVRAVRHLVVLARVGLLKRVRDGERVHVHRRLVAQVQGRRARVVGTLELARRAVVAAEVQARHALAVRALDRRVREARVRRGADRVEDLVGGREDRSVLPVKLGRERVGAHVVLEVVHRGRRQALAIEVRLREQAARVHARRGMRMQAAQAAAAARRRLITRRVDIAARDDLVDVAAGLRHGARVAADAVAAAHEAGRALLLRRAVVVERDEGAVPARLGADRVRRQRRARPRPLGARAVAASVRRPVAGHLLHRVRAGIGVRRAHRHDGVDRAVRVLGAQQVVRDALARRAHELAGRAIGVRPRQLAVEDVLHAVVGARALVEARRARERRRVGLVADERRLAVLERLERQLDLLLRIVHRHQVLVVHELGVRRRDQLRRVVVRRRAGHGRALLQAVLALRGRVRALAGKRARLAADARGVRARQEGSAAVADGRARLVGARDLARRASGRRRRAHLVVLEAATVAAHGLRHRAAVLRLHRERVLLARAVWRLEERAALLDLLRLLVALDRALAAAHDGLRGRAAVVDRALPLVAHALAVVAQVRLQRRAS
mmetsp:Transcript_15940/g.55575  ORF Transcript_15940/g.55575 Transcript_15940/m.55575 type:complete len:1363 (+) Transcript_15940:2345-6433(+)